MCVVVRVVCDQVTFLLCQCRVSLTTCCTVLVRSLSMAAAAGKTGEEREGEGRGGEGRGGGRGWEGREPSNSVLCSSCVCVHC